MENWLQIVLAVFASSGLWAFLQALLNRKSAKTRMILGLGHDRIICLCSNYIDRGWISNDEYEDLFKYLYEPYTKMGGNGTAKRLMDEVGRLPIRNIHVQQRANVGTAQPQPVPQG